jgi:hypothetical protein
MEVEVLAINQTYHNGVTAECIILSTITNTTFYTIRADDGGGML